MADFKATVEFPDLNTAPSTDDIDQSQLITGDEVYITKKQVVEVPPVSDFDIYGEGVEAPPIEDLEIIDLKTTIAPHINEYTPILRDTSGRVLLSFNGALDTYKVVVQYTSDAWHEHLIPITDQEHALLYAAGAVQLTLQWRPFGFTGVYQLGLWLDGIGKWYFMGLPELIKESPRYGGVLSKGFRNLTVVNIESPEPLEFIDANLVTYETTDTDIVIRKVSYSGDSLIDTTDPVAVEYDADITKVYHNQILMVDTLTENSTVNIDDLATHFRVLYSPDAEVNHTMELSFPNDTFTLGYAGDDIIFTRLGDGTWFYTNKRNNEKGAF